MDSVRLRFDRLVMDSRFRYVGEEFIKTARDRAAAKSFNFDKTHSQFFKPCIRVEVLATPCKLVCK